jgi:hypothetical protein
MTDRAKYEKLDDIGFVGVQEQKSAGAIRYQQRKTGELIRRARAAAKASSVKRRHVKKAPK